MYGMIHRAAREMILEDRDPATWSRILQQAGLEERDFISGQAYPDETTFALIGAAAAELGLSLEDTLLAFGRYWIQFANRSAFSALMKMAGSDISEFSGNLDRLHDNIRLSLPGVDAPSFLVVSSDDSAIRIAYRSSRTGLESFVTGLFEGLLLHFGQTGQVQCLGPCNGATDFLITLNP